MTAKLMVVWVRLSIKLPGICHQISNNSLHARNYVSDIDVLIFARVDTAAMMNKKTTLILKYVDSRVSSRLPTAQFSVP